MKISRTTKYVGAVATVVVALFIVVIGFSAAQSRYECEGTFVAPGANSSGTVFVKLEQYRWWVGLWSNSSGSLWLEVPNQTVEYFGRISRAGDQLQIYASNDQLAGQFSTLSKAFAITLSSGVSFGGTCKAIDA